MKPVIPFLLIGLVAGSHEAQRASAAQAPSSASNGAAVTTLAGSGERGFRDGPAATAQFLMPVGVAVAPDGSLIIADQAAQRIRKLSKGVVTTIAGGGEDADHIGHVPGGDVDGPAATARFNEPTGVAINASGDIFISDQMNHCIRKLSHGMVSTYAGNKDTPGGLDGPVATATFTRPMAIAIASDGFLYVADYKVGVREISPSGIVKTFGGGSDLKRFVAIGVAGTGDAKTVVVSEATGTYFTIKPSSGVSNGYDGAESGEYLRLSGLAGINEFQFVGADIEKNEIRLLRLNDKPQVTNNAAPVIAGSPTLEQQNSGGFRNAGLTASLFYSPFGVAVSGRTIVVCDTGNRRIRAFPLPDLRRPIGSQLENLPKDTSTYNIVTTGASHSFWATAWADSIPGLIEKRLNDDYTTIGLKRKAKVAVVRIDSAGLQPQADYLTNFESNGGADLVVMMLTAPDLADVTPLANETKPEAAVRVLKALNAKLRATHTKLFVHVRPEAVMVSQVDDIWDNITSDSPFYDNANYVNSIKTEQIQILENSGVSYYYAQDAYKAYEARPDRLPLWPFRDSHENLNGRRFIAADIVSQLKKLRPWTSK